MPKYDYDLIVIGGGAGGLTASTFAGQSAVKTLLIEKERKLGGDCLHYGCVPSKSLIKSAYAYNVMRNAHKYGLPDVNLSPVDFKNVAKRIKDIINVIQDHDEPEYLQEKFNVITRFGSPKFLDNHTIRLGEEKITSRYFVVATGSSPFIPPIKGIDDISYLTNLDIFSLDKLPGSLVIIGGGPIGMEMAQAFHRLGSKVTVLEGMDKFLPKEDEDISIFVKARLDTEGMDIQLGVEILEFKEESGKTLIFYKDKKTGDQKQIQAESVLIATGRKANVDGLDLERAGIQFSAKGINVDRKMRTTAKNIYAVGDVTGGLQFTHVASYEAIVAITNMIYKFPSKTNYARIPWVTYLDPEIASIGYNEQRAKSEGIDYIKHVEYIDHNDRALAEGENKGLIKILMNKSGKVIGVQIVSFHAGDLIAEWIPVLNGNLKLSTLANAVHPYPTMGEINKNASVNYMVSTVPSWTKKILKLLFGYKGVV